MKVLGKLMAWLVLFAGVGDILIGFFVSNKNAGVLLALIFVLIIFYYAYRYSDIPVAVGVPLVGVILIGVIIWFSKNASALLALLLLGILLPSWSSPSKEKKQEDRENQEQEDEGGELS